jgi:hypothetical protein
MWWDRESYLSHLCFGDSPREMVVELFGLLLGTEERWREQGASEAEVELRAFAWDRASIIHAPFDQGPRNGLGEEVIEENARERIIRDRFGRRSILPLQVATLPLPQDFPIRDPAGWERVRDWFLPDEQRMDTQQLQQCAQLRREGGLMRFSIWGAYDILRQLMGDEEACMAVLEEPDMVADILTAVGDMQAAGIRQARQVTPIDVLFVHEDFAGKSGPLIGPQTIQKLFNPYYRRMWDLARSGGAQLFDMDSDGFVDPVVDALLDGGINALHPVEPGAGSDMVRLRQRYGKRLTLRGGIDKFALTRGRVAIDAELDHRLDACLRGGGTMFALDHRIPAEVTLEAYWYYVRGLRQRLGLPPPEQDEPGWCRMA